MKLEEIEKYYFNLQQDVALESSHRIRVELLLTYFDLLPLDLNDHLIRLYTTTPLKWLCESLQGFVLSELSIPKLEQALDILQRYPSPEGRLTLAADRQYHLREWLAKKWIWVGEPRKGLRILFPEIGIDQETEESTSLHPLQRAKQIRNATMTGSIRSWLTQFIAEWDSLLIHATRDSLPILGIDLKGDGGVPENPSGCLLDINIYTNQKRRSRLNVRVVPSPPVGDPIYTAVANALAAAIKVSGLSIYSGEWEVRPSDPNSELSQSSLGASAAALLLNQLLHDRLQPHRKFLHISATTAEIDQDGILRPVNETYIRAKVERTFFSPLENIFVAQGQGRLFNEAVNQWQRRYPGKSLEIIECQSLSELMYDHRFAHATRTKLPIWIVDRLLERKAIAGAAIFTLIATGIYFLLNLLPPMYNPLIDHNPSQFDTQQSYPLISVYNRNNQWLWSYDVESQRLSNYTKSTEVLGNLGGNRSLTQMGDVDGDGHPEIFLMLNNPSDTIPGSLMRLSWRGKLEEFAPLPIPENCPSPPPEHITWTAGDIQLVDWNNSGFGKLYITIRRRDGHQICGIMEVDPDLRHIEGVLWKDEWWIPLLKVRQKHSTVLVGGSRTSHGGTALLTIFHNRIPFGIWPPADTTGVQIYRFPIDPLLKKIGASMFVNGLDMQDRPPIRVAIGCLEMQDYRRLCSYWFDINGSYLKLDHSESQWLSRQKLAHSYSIPIEESIWQYREYMDHPEIWTGSAWQPLDSMDALPESAYSVLHP